MWLRITQYNRTIHVGAFTAQRFLTGNVSLIHAQIFHVKTFLLINIKILLPPLVCHSSLTLLIALAQLYVPFSSLCRAWTVLASCVRHYSLAFEPDRNNLVSTTGFKTRSRDAK